MEFKITMNKNNPIFYFLSFDEILSNISNREHPLSLFTNLEECVQNGANVHLGFVKEITEDYIIIDTTKESDIDILNSLNLADYVADIDFTITNSLIHYRGENLIKKIYILAFSLIKNNKSKDGEIK